MRGLMTAYRVDEGWLRSVIFDVTFFRLSLPRCSEHVVPHWLSCQVSSAHHTVEDRDGRPRIREPVGFMYFRNLWAVLTPLFSLVIRYNLKYSVSRLIKCEQLGRTVHAMRVHRKAPMLKIEAFVHCQWLPDRWSENYEHGGKSPSAAHALNG